MIRFFSYLLPLFLLCSTLLSADTQPHHFTNVQQVSNDFLTTPTPIAPRAAVTQGQTTTPLSISLPESTASLSNTPSIIVQTVSLVLLALLPYLFILLTSYIKLVVVLSLLRNAIGVQQSPPNQVINGLAIILSIYVMFPTGLAMYNSAESLIKSRGNHSSGFFSKESSFFLLEVTNAAKEPMRDFLIRNSQSKQLKGFYQLAHKVLPETARAELKPTDFLIVIPAYITSQLKDAYEIGVLIYLPFFVIDLVTSNILLAMGMMMLSPLTIALPLKLLLLVMVDGWTLLVQGLVLSFK